jgi:hypothetical protein
MVLNSWLPRGFPSRQSVQLKERQMPSRIFIAVIFIQILMCSLIPYAHSGELPQAEQTIQATALNLARCSGVYAAVSEVHAATNAPALSKTTKETSNGAGIAATYLLLSTGLMPEWNNATTYVQNTASSQKLSYMASFEKYTDPNKALDELTNALKDCNKLSELQEKLIQEARYKAYSRKDQ